MYKTLSSLSKIEKLELLKLVASGEVKRSELSKDAKFITERGEAFEMFMNKVDNPDTPNVIALGKAAIELNETLKWMDEIITRYPQDEKSNKKNENHV